MKLTLNIFSLIILFQACNVNNATKEIEQPLKTEAITEIQIEERDTIADKKNVSTSFIATLENQGLVRINSLDPTIQVELKYATTNNFTKGILYDELNDAYLHPIAANKLITAQKLLKKENDSLSLLIYDAVRPLSVQRKMYKVVQNTPYHKYVANPSRTGLHNYGIAVDLTICDQRGKPLDMGTSFDFFGRTAGINDEESLIKEGKLTRKQVNNRKLLRKVMTDAGFLTIRGEWWHFNALSLSDAKRKTNLIE